MMKRNRALSFKADENVSYIGVTVRKRPESSIHLASSSIVPFKEKSVSRVVGSVLLLRSLLAILYRLTRLKILRKIGPIFVYRHGCEI